MDTLQMNVIVNATTVLAIHRSTQAPAVTTESAGAVPRLRAVQVRQLTTSDLHSNAHETTRTDTQAIIRHLQARLKRGATTRLHRVYARLHLADTMTTQETILRAASVLPRLFATETATTWTGMVTRRTTGASLRRLVGCPHRDRHRLTPEAGTEETIVVTLHRGRNLLPALTSRISCSIYLFASLLFTRRILLHVHAQRSAM